MPLNHNAIGKRIQTLRREKKITQEQLAESVDLSVVQISYIENGRSRLFLDSLVNIATVLDASTDEILFGHVRTDTNYRFEECFNLFSDCDQTEMRILYETSHRLKELLREEKKKKG